MINVRKKRHGAIEVADPKLGGAGVEIERAFFVDLALGIRRGKNLDADLWSPHKNDRVLADLRPVVLEPGDVNDLDAICGRDSTFRGRLTVRQERMQEADDVVLTARMTEGRRWSHEYMPVPIGLDPIREPGQPWISHDLGPASEIEAGLRLEIRELDHDSHAGKIRQKWEKA